MDSASLAASVILGLNNEEILKKQLAIKSLKEMLITTEKQRQTLGKENRRIKFDNKELENEMQLIRATTEQQATHVNNAKNALEMAEDFRKSKEEAEAVRAKEAEKVEKEDAKELQMYEKKWDEYLVIYKQFPFAEEYHKKLDDFEVANTKALNTEKLLQQCKEENKHTEKQINELLSKPQIKASLKQFCIELAEQWLYVKNTSSNASKIAKLKALRHQCYKNQMVLRFSQSNIPEAVAKDKSRSQDEVNPKTPRHKSQMAEMIDEMHLNRSFDSKSQSTPDAKKKSPIKQLEVTLAKPAPILSSMPFADVEDVRRSYSLTNITNLPKEHTNIMQRSLSIQHLDKNDAKTATLTMPSKCGLNYGPCVQSWIEPPRSENESFSTAKQTAPTLSEIPRPVEIPLLRAFQEHSIQQKTENVQSRNDTVHLPVHKENDKAQIFRSPSKRDISFNSVPCSPKVPEQIEQTNMEYQFKSPNDSFKVPPRKIQRKTPTKLDDVNSPNKFQFMTSPDPSPTKGDDATDSFPAFLTSNLMFGNDDNMGDNVEEDGGNCQVDFQFDGGIKSLDFSNEKQSFMFDSGFTDENKSLSFGEENGNFESAFTFQSENRSQSLFK